MAGRRAVKAFLNGAGAVGNALLDLLFPADAQCALCGQSGNAVCPACLEKLPPATLMHGGDGVLSGICSVYAYRGGARTLISLLKFQGVCRLSKPLGQKMAQVLLALPWEGPMAVVPVPLHPLRRARRGYNQSELLARQISRQTGWPLKTGLIKRVRNTQSQSRLPRPERLFNLQGAFARGRTKGPVPETVLLIDDVTTTGATLHTCAMALRAAGVSRVYGLTLCAVDNPSATIDADADQ